MELGFTELMFLLIFFLLLFGPDKLPEVARTIGRYYSEFNRYRKALEEEFRKGIEEGEKMVKFEDEKPKDVRPARKVKRNIKNGGGEVKEGNGE